MASQERIDQEIFAYRLEDPQPEEALKCQISIVNHLVPDLRTLLSLRKLIKQKKSLKSREPSIDETEVYSYQVPELIMAVRKLTLLTK